MDKIQLIKCLLLAFMTGIFINNAAFAQEQVTLGEALGIALKNNLKVRSSLLLEKYSRAKVNTSLAIDPLSVNTVLGQFNSTYFDTGIGLSQSFKLPGVGRKKKEAQQAEVRTAEYYTQLTEAEIREELEDVFDRYHWLEAKLSLARQVDTMYSEMAEKSRIRYQKGESDILESLTADRQRDEAQRQLHLLANEMEWTVIALNLLLNVPSTLYKPLAGKYSHLSVNELSDAPIGIHPAVAAAEQEWKTSIVQTAVEKTAAWPGLSAGYQNLSIRGTGADNEVYTAADRFSNVQLGVTIPVFRKGIRAGVEASKAMEEIRLNHLEQTRAAHAGEYASYLTRYRESARMLREYEAGALPDAATMLTVSRQKLSSGQINYLEFVQLINMATSIKSQYLDLLRATNSYAIRLHYLTNQFNF